MQWFDVDKKGLSKLMDGRGKIFVIHELLSNALDTDSPTVAITTERRLGDRYVRVTVKDEHPEGFKDLAHAWTLFGESERKGQTEKRGRFNFGEKMVLALCKTANITTTTGCVVFSEKGRVQTKERTDKGSVFMGLIQMTNDDLADIARDIDKVIVPEDRVVTYNGRQLPHRPKLLELQVSLPTVVPDADGVMRKTERKTTVQVFEVLDGVGSIHEMGIPVVETGDTYDINILQKVPLTMERDNVSPSYLRRVRAAVAEALVAANNMTPETAQEAWVTDALSASNASKEMVQAIVTARFGEKAAVFDPSDKEANNRLTAKGFTVVHGRSLPKEAWANVRDAGALIPSGTLSPTPKPYSDDPNAPPVTVVPESEWTEGMRAVAEFSKRVARDTMNVNVTIRMVKARGFAACYGRSGPHDGRLDYNVASLLNDWFDERPVVKVVDLLVHELAHHTESNHLSERYYHACTLLAGQVAQLALTAPEAFSMLGRA